MNREKEKSKLDAELLEEIRQWEMEDETDEESPGEYRFTNAAPYAKCEPLPGDHEHHDFYFGEDGHIRVKNLSAYWIPELTVTEKIGGTIYTVTGSYEGTETFIRKLERIIAKKFTERWRDRNDKHSKS